MNLLESTIFYQLLAQAYGESNYSSDVYGGQETEQETGTDTGTGTGTGTNTGTTQDTTPQAPLTGLFSEQPASVIIPALLLVAVLIGTISFLISRSIRNRRNTK